MMAEQDLDLWREYQKGADEAWTRVEEQEYWYYLALDEWYYQDGIKEARLQQENADRAAGAREEAQEYRAGVMNYYESEIEGLEDQIYGIEEELDSLWIVLRDNEDDAAGSAYETAYDEIEDYYTDLREFEEEEWEFEYDLEELELEQLWDDTAAAHDGYIQAEMDYEAAIDRNYWAWEDYYEADWYWYEADDALW